MVYSVSTYPSSARLSAVVAGAPAAMFLTRTTWDRSNPAPGALTAASVVVGRPEVPVVAAEPRSLEPPAQPASTTSAAMANGFRHRRAESYGTLSGIASSPSNGGDR